ncbi:MAG: hypothetical protein ACMG51_07365 [Ginsengibacter sp.]
MNRKNKANGSFLSPQGGNQRYLFIVLFIIVLSSCGSNKKAPDVSSVKVDLATYRYEQDFFSIDTNHIATSIQALIKKYPRFTPDFIESILGLDLDSLTIEGNGQAQAIKLFLHDYRSLKDSAELIYNDFSKESKEIKKALQYVKYYFPEYSIPKNVITFIGPINANFETSFGTQGDILTPEGIGIGLTLHLGKNFSFYRSAEGREQYPDYMANNFDREHITVNCMRNITDDLFPYKNDGDALIEQMVERGKRFYLISKFLPETDENIIIGFTKLQMKDVMSHEALIWQFYLNNDLLNISDQNVVKNYIGESPKTPELGEGAPGNLGSFSGWQIVKKFMSQNDKVSLQELMRMPPREVYQQSKYRPRD